LSYSAALPSPSSSSVDAEATALRVFLIEQTTTSFDFTCILVFVSVITINIGNGPLFAFQSLCNLSIVLCSSLPYNRLNVINNIIKKDFDGKVTKEQLESRNLINIKLKPEVKAVVEKDFIEQDRRNEAIREQKTWENTIRVAREKEIQRLEKESKRINEDNNAVNGRDIGRLITGMGFFTAAAHGREVVIGEIRADKKQDGS